MTRDDALQPGAVPRVDRGGRTKPRSRTFLAALALLVPVGLAAWFGGHGPGRVELDLGPGDGPYVEGFTEAYAVLGRESTHWTTYDAAIALPLAVRGGPVTLSYRYARDFPETAEVEVLLGGAPVDRFSARGGEPQTRSVTLATVDERPLRIGILSDSHERRNMGLKLDWVRLEYGASATARLAGFTALRPALVALLVFLTFRLLGWSSVATLLLSLPVASALTVGLVASPWVTHRFLTGIPLAVTLYALAALSVGALLVRRGVVSRGSRRIVTTLAFSAFLLRAALVSHPDFYHPDLRTHATLVETLREGRLDFFRSPSTYIERHGRWATEAYGETYAFPYSPAFHLPFAVLGLSYDALIVWMKLFAAACSTIPLVLVWVLARAFGLSPWGSALMAIIPTYTSRLSFAFFPSLFGHAFDTALICWLALRWDRLGERRFWLAGALFVAASELAYVSGPLNVGVFLALVFALELARRREEARRRALAVLVMLAGGSLVAFLAFYRDFLPMVADVLSRMSGGVAGAKSRYEVRGFLDVAYTRTRSFFGALYPALTAVGLVRVGTRAAAVTLLWGWLLAYFVLLFGRAKVPNLFLHGHETLFLTPLVCLVSGGVLGSLWARGGARRAFAVLVLSVLTVQGLYLQWRSITEQFLP